MATTADHHQHIARNTSIQLHRSVLEPGKPFMLFLCLNVTLNLDVKSRTEFDLDLDVERVRERERVELDSSADDRVLGLVLEVEAHCLRGRRGVRHGARCVSNEQAHDVIGLQQYALRVVVGVQRYLQGSDVRTSIRQTNAA